MEDLALTLIQSGFVVLDTETTGLGNVDEILQIAVVDSDGRVLLNSLVRPCVAERWPEATRVHGITPEMVAESPPFSDIVEELRDALAGRVVCIYNADYDVRMLKQSARAAGVDANWIGDLKTVDIMEPYAEYWGDWHEYYGNYRWQPLTKACRQQRVEISDAHSALGDCLMTLELLRAVSTKAAKESEGGE